MSTLPHAVPSRMTNTVAALFGHSDDTLIAWQQACVHAADALPPPPDPERLAKALALAHNGAVALEDDGAALVTSGGTRYRVEADGTCHCPDAQHRGAPCKHGLAVQIHQQATASLVPGAAAPRVATPQPAPAPDTRQDCLPSADRWDVKAAPASCCLRLRLGDLELICTMRDISDAELTSRVQHLVPWVQAVLDQAWERQVHLDTLRQQREAAHASPAASAPSAPQPTTPPADLQVLIQQAVQQVLTAQQPASTGQAPAPGQETSAPPPAPPSTGTPAANGAAPVCPLHQVAMEQRSNAHGSWYSHWLANEKRYCKGK